MFGKFFGKKKEEQPAAQQAKPQIADPSLKQEMSLHSIKSRISDIDDKIDHVDQRILSLDAQIRDLMAQKRTQQVRGKIAEMKGLQKQVEKYQVNRNVLTQLAIQIETLELDLGIAQNIREAVDLGKQYEQVNEQLQDDIMDWKELQQSQAETFEMQKQLANMGVDQSELDDEFSRYEQEVNAQQQQDLNKQFAQIPQQKIPQVQSSLSKQDQQFQSNVQALLE